MAQRSKRRDSHRSQCRSARYRHTVSDAALDRARSLISDARHVVALTGAGISTASGIPDFRGPQGVWTKDPHAEMLSTFTTWVTNESVRRAAWRSRVERQVFDVEPNEGHRALVRLEQRGHLDLLVTQNIDGLHQKAGTSRDHIVEIHGSALEVVCLECGARDPIDVALDRVREGDDDPQCQRIVNSVLCGGLLKSGTISFGQSLVAEDLARSENAARLCDVFLAIGTTLAVYPVAGLLPTAKSHGAAIIIVNGNETAMDDMAHVLVRGDIPTVLPVLVD